MKNSNPWHCDNSVIKSRTKEGIDLQKTADICYSLLKVVSKNFTLVYHNLYKDDGSNTFRTHLISTVFFSMSPIKSSSFLYQNPLSSSSSPSIMHSRVTTSPTLKAVVSSFSLKTLLAKKQKITLSSYVYWYLTISQTQ